MRFRKTPVVIDAWQWSPGKDGWPHWLVKAIDSRDVIMAGDDQLVIITLEGDMKVSNGDWVIRGVAGELYPCKPYIFAVTYEPAE